MSELSPVALLLRGPLGHLHPTRPPPLHHLQHPQGDLLDDEHAGQVQSCSAFLDPKILFSSSLRLSWCGSRQWTTQTRRSDKNVLLYSVWIGINFF